LFLTRFLLREFFTRTDVHFRWKTLWCIRQDVSRKSCWKTAMTDVIRPLIAGNWKMNGLKASMTEFEAMLAGAPAVAGKVDLLVCPP